MKKKYVVFGMHLAGFLMMRKHVLQALSYSDKSHVDKKVFIFNETEYLLRDIAEYKTLYKKDK